MVFVAAALAAQSPVPDRAPERSDPLPPEARQFDFWLGAWDVNLRVLQQDKTWKDSIRAEARIYSVLDGKAVLELWESAPIRGFSLRYFDVAQNRWVLWLNWPGAGRSASSGLEGSFRHGRGDFYSTSTNAEGEETLSRYTFTDITPESLRWNDGYSKDGGKTWVESWIMEFSRTAPAATLPPQGGPAHTFQGGDLCPAEAFRTFEQLAGRHKGTASWKDEAGTWHESPAELVGYRINGGCAVFSLLRTERGGSTWEEAWLHTWNTVAEMYEESRLTSAAASSLEVFYGAREADGSIPLLRSGNHGAEAGTARRRWSLAEGEARLEAEIQASDGQGWQATFRLDLAPLPGGDG